ncbi:MAG: hypothetical protein M1828_005583 [Chrysothrix sp. TS-e1954]|nr:MAG: hypothetical protein M1828_005583 [Chrysothrix sp. TS-e1954]
MSIDIIPNEVLQDILRLSLRTILTFPLTSMHRPCRCRYDHEWKHPKLYPFEAVNDTAREAREAALWPERGTARTPGPENCCCGHHADGWQRNDFCCKVFSNREEALAPLSTIARVNRRFRAAGSAVVREFSQELHACYTNACRKYETGILLDKQEFAMNETMWGNNYIVNYQFPRSSYVTRFRHLVNDYFQIIDGFDTYVSTVWNDERTRAWIAANPTLLSAREVKQTAYLAGWSYWELTWEEHSARVYGEIMRYMQRSGELLDLQPPAEIWKPDPSFKITRKPFVW